jgi:hypothetical protein
MTRRLQFSLRTLLTLMLAVACFSGGIYVESQWHLRDSLRPEQPRPPVPTNWLPGGTTTDGFPAEDLSHFDDVFRWFQETGSTEGAAEPSFTVVTQ